MKTTSRRTKLRRPPLTEKTMSGLMEISAYIETLEPADVLGDDPRSWRGTPQAAELTRRWEAVQSACKWIQQLQVHKVRKRAARPPKDREG